MIAKAVHYLNQHELVTNSGGVTDFNEEEEFLIEQELKMEGSQSIDEQ
jgi:hypothetical protein